MSAFPTGIFWHVNQGEADPDIAFFDPEHTELNMTLKQSIDWKNEWFPIDDATYLNFAAHAAIPRVALNAVQASVAAKMRPHIVDDLFLFLRCREFCVQTLATLIWGESR